MNVQYSYNDTALREQHKCMPMSYVIAACKHAVEAVAAKWIKAVVGGGGAGG